MTRISILKIEKTKVLQKHSKRIQGQIERCSRNSTAEDHTFRASVEYNSAYSATNLYYLKYSAMKFVSGLNCWHWLQLMLCGAVSGK